MDSDTLIFEMDFIAENGDSLSSEYRTMLQNSLANLKKTGNFHKVFFGGKIFGNGEDYFFAEGVRQSCLRERQTFYSLDGRRWNLLPPPDPLLVQMTLPLRRLFTGDPSVELVVAQPRNLLREETTSLDSDVDDLGDAAEEEEEEEEFPDDFLTKKPIESELKEKIPEVLIEKSITEEDRLSCVIHSILDDTLIVPRGAFIRTPAGEVYQNRFFRGLSLSDSKRMDSFVHLRYPQREISDKRVVYSEMERAIDFLDVISEDVPKGCWSQQIEFTRGTVTLRSLWWPGSVFYHKIDTKHFGNLYYGYGLKNMDLPFMLP